MYTSLLLEGEGGMGVSLAGWVFLMAIRSNMIEGQTSWEYMLSMVFEVRAV